MSDAYDGNANPRCLEDYYAVYGPSRFRKNNGEPHKRRSLQIFAKKFDLPLIRAGNCTLIDPAAGDDRLREHAHRPAAAEPLFRRRGRPPRRDAEASATAWARRHTEHPYFRRASGRMTDIKPMIFNEKPPPVTIPTGAISVRGFQHGARKTPPPFYQT
jgi:hypothetical protein